ncbi:MAG: HAMP domain-containing histidine kinase [Proteobacteria bacterium]|nr:HAMP domain-containing histidine kinase [Pseudomonadota bacterium]
MTERANEPGTRRSSARHRPRLTILVKLLLAFAVPTMLLFSVFAAVAHEVARGDLEAELGIRLSAIASSAALQVRGKYLVDLGPGDESDRAHQNARRKLEAVRLATGAARIYVFDRAFRSRLDTAGDTPIGAVHYQAELDRHELSRVFDRGAQVASVLFEGADGNLYKAGYAAVRASEREGAIVLALAVEAPAAFFGRLADLRRSLLFYGALLALVVLAISIVVAALITRPVRHLVAAAERIGHGDLHARVERRSHDEIGFLAETMEEMRRDLYARDERLQLMLSGIAHEVRNPLGGIELFAGILRDELDSSDQRRAHVERIERELGYLKAVVNDFLAYARRPIPELSDVDLAEIAADVADLLRADAAEAGVTVQLDTQPTPCRGDPGQLRRALLNLVRNAVQASTGIDNGQVRVTAAADGQRVRLCVSNRGEPIPRHVRQRMFEPFYTTREKGTGLGLAFVREIVADHNGRVTVESREDETLFQIEMDGTTRKTG